MKINFLPLLMLILGPNIVPGGTPCLVLKNNVSGFNWKKLFYYWNFYLVLTLLHIDWVWQHQLTAKSCAYRSLSESLVHTASHSLPLLGHKLQNQQHETICNKLLTIIFVLISANMYLGSLRLDVRGYGALVGFKQKPKKELTGHVRYLLQSTVKY